MSTALKRSALIFALALALLLIATPTAWATDVRVLLETTTNDAFSAYTEDGDYELLDERGGYLARIRPGADVEIESYRSGYSVYINSKLAAEGLSDFMLEAEDEDCLFEYNGKLYRGSLRVVKNSASTYIINNLDLEYYLYGVVGREIGYNQPLEAAKAQAVASRSFAVANLNPANKYYDIGSASSAQSYGGYSAEKEASAGNIVRAVDATEGEIICYRGKPFPGYYHSNGGGHTEDIVNVWGGSIPLKGVPSPYDNYVEKSGYSNSIYQWQVRYTKTELLDMAERYAGRSIGEYRGLELSTIGANGQPSASGRVMEAVIKGSNGQISAQRDEIRTLFGNLKSTLFNLDGAGSVATLASGSTLYVLDKGQSSPTPVTDIGSWNVQSSGNIISRLADWGSNFIIRGAQQSVTYGSGSSNTGSASSNAETVTFYGKGNGHGVGMSQWGAIGMAADDHHYREILSLYYNMDTNRDFTLEYY